MEARDLSGQDKENLTGEVMQNLGEPEDGAESSGNDTEAQGTEANQEELPLFAKEKIGKMQKRHQRDMRRMQEQLNAMQSQAQGSQNQVSPDQSAGQPLGMQPSNDVDGLIQRAVSGALAQRDMQERKAKDAEQQANIAKKYQTFKQRLDKGSDKYDDFDDVVLGHDVPITNTIRDTAALLIDNPEEVLYKLGKNRPELERISKLPPDDQAREVIKLSAALMSGENKQSQQPKTLGQVKSTPVTSQGITEKSSPSEIRARMKAGTFR